MAACMTILSYMATAVISASAATHYAQNVIPGLPVQAATVALLALFALLTILGITESSVVAVGIFALHILTRTCICLIGAMYIIRDPSTLIANWHAPTEQSLAPPSSSASRRRSWVSAGSRARPTSSRSSGRGCSRRRCATCGSP
jgi:amino acid transporter